MSVPTRIFRDDNSQALVIEGLGSFPLNSLSVTDVSGNGLVLGGVVLNSGGTVVFEIDPADVRDGSGDPLPVPTVAAFQAYFDSQVNFTLATEAGVTAAQADATQALSDAADATLIATNAGNTASQALTEAQSRVESVSALAGRNVVVDNTDPLNPIVEGSVYGLNFQMVQSDAVSIITTVPAPNSITGTFPGPVYLTLTTPALPLGDYLFEWGYSWAYDSATQDFLARINQNSGTFFGLHRQEPKDAANAPGDGFPGAGTNQRYWTTGKRLLTGLSGVNTFELEHATSSGGVEATIGTGYLLIYRVS